MVRQLRHRQTKGAATAAMNLLPPRHISTSQQNQVHPHGEDISFNNTRFLRPPWAINMPNIRNASDSIFNTHCWNFKRHALLELQEAVHNALAGVRPRRRQWGVVSAENFLRILEDVTCAH
jgi:hypothetical protein